MDLINYLFSVSRQSDSKINQNGAVFVSQEGVLLVDGFSKVFSETQEISAELNALIKANLTQVSLANSIAYLTTFPTRHMAKVLCELKINKLTFIEDHPDMDAGMDLLTDNNVEVYKYEVLTQSFNRLLITTPRTEQEKQEFFGGNQEEPVKKKDRKKYFE